MRCGTSGSNAAAAPATVSGKPAPLRHWTHREGGKGNEPRARRPAVDSILRRAGCLGAGRSGHSTRIQFEFVEGAGDLYRSDEPV